MDVAHIASVLLEGGLTVLLRGEPLQGMSLRDDISPLYLKHRLWPHP